MPVHILMDQHGDTRHTFDIGDPQAVARAKAHFEKLTSRGYRAVALGRDGQPGVLVRTFDPTVKEVLFVPQLQGG